MPYTLLGAALMLYCQARLLRGQHAMAQPVPVKNGKSKKKKSQRRKQTALIIAIDANAYSGD
jgi:hypothetical protein